MRIVPLTALGVFLVGAGLGCGYSPVAHSDTTPGALGPKAPATPAPASTAPTTGNRREPDLARQRREPIHISADSIEINQQKGFAHYRGHVVFVQGGLRITATQATARIRNNVVQSVSAEGSPITFHQSASTPDQEIRGSATRMEYDAVKQKLSLYGDVHFDQGSDSMRSATLHYDIASGTVTAEAGSARDQVHVVIQPARLPGGPTDTGASAPKVTK